MGDNITVSVNIPLDEDGMIGRECLECKRYFKLKPGTGLPTNYCHCPYCEYEGKSDTFWTPAQVEYATSVGLNQAFNQLIKPSLDKLTQSFKNLERSTKNSFLQISVETTGQNFSFPVKYYSEEEVETHITCDSCELVFSIYGVFARCPDCNEFNAFLIYEKSLEVTQKHLDMFSKPEMPTDIKEQSLSFVLSSSISAFDGLGKELKKRKPNLYPEKPKNLFQNLSFLNEKLNNLISNKHSNYPFLSKLFQVRHLYEHTMGVIDDDFIKKIPQYSNMLNRKYSLTAEELQQFIKSMRELGIIIKDHFK